MNFCVSISRGVVYLPISQLLNLQFIDDCTVICISSNNTNGFVNIKGFYFTGEQSNGEGDTRRAKETAWEHSIYAQKNSI